MSKQSHELAYRAYTVVKRENADDFWLAIGAAFKNSDDSYNVILQALPIPNGDGVCKIVLRPPREEQQQDDDRPADRDRFARKSGQQRR